MEKDVFNKILETKDLFDFFFMIRDHEISEEEWNNTPELVEHHSKLFKEAKEEFDRTIGAGCIIEHRKKK